MEEHVRERYGEMPVSTIEIQIERARERLRAFAKWQAEWRKSGYEIVDVEYNPATQIVVAGIQLRGQIDRIDRRDKELVVFDYKTGDDSPETKHRNSKGWKDFQLPLYHYILRQSGYAKADDVIRLGYMTISKNVKNIREQIVNWDESVVQDGIAEAVKLIEEIATRDWSTILPVIPPPQYSEDFEFICQDGIS